jgi:hypothetical protein
MVYELRGKFTFVEMFKQFSVKRNGTHVFLQVCAEAELLAEIRQKS